MKRHAKAPSVGSTAEGSSAPAAVLLAAAAAAAAALVVLVLLLGAGVSPAPATAASGDCANEIRRQEQGVLALALPHCRAYEMVSPGAFPQQWEPGTSRGARTSLDGNKFAYFEFYPGTDMETSGMQYLSKRGAKGWAPEVAVPQQTQAAVYSYVCDPQVFYSSDFSLNVLQSGYHNWYVQSRAGCKTNEAVLDPRENREYQNLFLHDNGAGAYELISVYPEGATPSNSQMQSYSPDLGTVVFAALTPDLTPDSPPGLNYYVASEGAIRLLGVLPDGTPFEGSEFFPIGPQSEVVGAEAPVRINADLVGSRMYSIASGGGVVEVPNDENHSLIRRSVSADGKRIFFYAGDRLYVRLNPAQPQSAIAGGECTEASMACTIQIDESQGPDSGGGGRMSFASADGSKAFFTSAGKLTSDSTAEPGKEDLYEYELETGTLTDLTVDAGEAADVRNVVWVTEDGSRAFFMSPAALDSGALPGNCDETAEGNFCNLYMVHDGSVEFIAALPTRESRNWGYSESDPGEVLRRNYGVGKMLASPDGSFFAFPSSANLTAYDSDGVEELYLYDTDSGQIQCASCPAIGQPSKGVWFWNYLNIDGAMAPGPLTRLTDNGRVFFETEDQLVQRDTNESVDVYMYEGGEQHLLSGGKGEHNAHFLDATSSGGDVFFVTAEPLLASDTDGASSIYDARIGGGFPEPPPLPACEGEACRGAGTSAPVAGATGSATFQGPGNRAKGRRAACGLESKRALRLSRDAKSLRRKAKSAEGERAIRLRRQAAKLAKQSEKVSKGAKRCRRSNARAGK